MNIPEIIDVHFIQLIVAGFSAPSMNPNVSHFHYTNWLIGIVMMDYHNPYIV